MSEDTAQPPISPTAIPLADAARLLSKIGGQPVSPGMLQTDLEFGAPANPNGTLNLLHYAAWLVRELANGN